MNKGFLFLLSFLSFFLLSTYSFIYFYPRFIMARTKQKLTNCRIASPGCAPVNTFGHLTRLATPEETIVVNPNNDTLYSSAWLELSNEPLVIHMPDMQGRYFSLQFLDSWTNVFAYRGRRTLPKASDVLIVGPRWTRPLPADIPIIKAPTSSVWIIGRILVTGPDDLSSALALQRELTITPFSSYLKNKIPPKTPREARMKTIIINVLSSDVYNDCHITGSVNVPLADLENYAKKLDKDDQIIVYCAHYQCPASKKAWKTLHDLGFVQVKAYEGGMREWYQERLPCQGPCKAEYLTSPNKPQPAEKDIATITAQELKQKIGDET